MGNKSTDAVARTRMRKQWRTWGMDESEIEACSRQVRERQRLKNQGLLPLDAPLCTRAEYVRLLRKQPSVKPQGTTVLRLGDDYEHPSDVGYKPTQHDSITTGAARVTGATAQAAKRGKTITKYQYDSREK